MTMTLLWLLAACGGGDKTLAEVPAGDPATSTSLTTSTVPVPTTPELWFTDPGPAGYASSGTVTIAGDAALMNSVTVNGVAATVADHRFEADFDLLPGIHGMWIEGVDEQGEAHAHQGAILAGTFAEPSGPSYDALQLHLGEGALAEIGPVVTALLTPDLINPVIQGLNPVVDSSDARVNLGDIRFDDAIVQASPTDQGLLLSMELPGFVLPIDAKIIDALPLGIDVNLDVDVEADLTLDVLIDLDTDGRGNLLVDIKHVQADLGEFDLDTGLLELIDWLFVDDDDLAVFIETQLENLGPSLDGAIGDMLNGLDLSMETELLGAQLSMQPAFDAASVDAEGVYLSIAVALEVDGPAPDAPGHLAFPTPPSTVHDQVQMKISDDFMNRALFEMWAGGAMNLEMDLSEGPASTLLLLFGGGSEGALALDPQLPPVWIERDGQGRLQMGEVLFTVETPGGDLGERVELLMNLDAAAEVSFDGTSAGVVLSDTVVEMVAVGESAGNEDLDVDSLAGAFSVGIGIINGLLEFPLDGLVPAGSLPAIAFERDPSGLGTQLELDISEVDVPTLLGLPVHEVPVPATAVPYAKDAEISDDQVVGWVCDDAEVTALGNDGTWFVASGGRLNVEGTGHQITVVDKGDVVLDAPKNAVQADPGADVDDNDGSNVVTVVDPTTLDLTNAPAYGCP